MKNGRPDGDGRLKLRSGLVYEGDWRDGAMEGKGLLRFANGEAFEGGFAGGAPDGAGRLTTPDGRVWQSVWRNGEEVERAPAEGRVQLAQAGTVAVNVYLDGKLNDEFRSAQDEDGFDRFTYQVDDSSGVLQIAARFPGDHVAVEGRCPDHGDASPGHFRLFRGLDPVRPGLRRGRYRQRGEPDRRGGWRLSRHRREHVRPPALSRCLWPGRRLQRAPRSRSSRSSTRAGARSRTPGSPIPSATRPSRVGQTFTAEIGSFEDSATPSIADSLQALGLDINRLQNDNFQCASEAEYAACIADWEGSDLLAGLSGATFNDGNAQILTRLWGILDYTWTDAKGGSNPRQSPVIIDFPVLDVGMGPECGAGGPVERGFPTAKLPLDETNVRIPINYQDTIAPREQKRFGLNFVADKSSRHHFRFVVELADGRTIASPDIDLTYFIPRSPAMN